VTGGRIVAVRAAAVPSTVMMRRGMPFFFEMVALAALLLGCRAGGVGGALAELRLSGGSSDYGWRSYSTERLVRLPSLQRSQQWAEDDLNAA